MNFLNNDEVEKYSTEAWVSALQKVYPTITSLTMLINKPIELANGKQNVIEAKIKFAAKIEAYFNKQISLADLKKYFAERKEQIIVETTKEHLDFYLENRLEATDHIKATALYELTAKFVNKFNKRDQFNMPLDANWFNTLNEFYPKINSIDELYKKPRELCLPIELECLLGHQMSSYKKRDATVQDVTTFYQQNIKGYYQTNSKLEDFKISIYSNSPQFFTPKRRDKHAESPYKAIENINGVNASWLAEQGKNLLIDENSFIFKDTIYQTLTSLRDTLFGTSSTSPSAVKSAERVQNQEDGLVPESENSFSG